MLLNLNLNYQRNIESMRLSNKTSMKLGDTTFEAGGYALRKRLQHPIYQVLDYTYNDFGAYGRAVDERDIAGMANRLTLGVTISGGWVDNTHSTNVGGNKGARVSASADRAVNYIAYGENALEVVPDVTVVAGLQAVHALRRRTDRFDNATDTSGENEYTLINPKVGLLWQVDPEWQVFSNLSRSSEAPTFSELNFTNATLATTEAQRLVEVALEAGAKSSYRVDDASEIDEAWLDGVRTVSVTSGASVPEALVQGVLEFLAERGYPDAKAVQSAEESLIFALPKELRRDLKAAAAAAQG